MYRPILYVEGLVETILDPVSNNAAACHMGEYLLLSKLKTFVDRLENIKRLGESVSLGQATPALDSVKLASP